MRFSKFRLADLNRRMKRRLGTLIRREDGVALVEFAMVAPVMITMYLGMVELSMAVGHERKSTMIVRTLADLTTQQSSVSNTDLATIFSATSAILAPYPVAEVSMRITSIRIDSKGKTFVDWSEVKDIARSGGGFTALARCGDGAALVPAPLRVAGTSLVLTDTSILHTPVVGKFVGHIDMKETFQMRPRVSATVGREGVPTTPCPGEVP